MNCEVDIKCIAGKSGGGGEGEVVNMANQRSCIRQLLTQDEYRGTVTNELTKHCLLLGSGRQTISPIYFQHGPVPANPFQLYPPDKGVNLSLFPGNGSCHTVFFWLIHLHWRESTDVSETFSLHLEHIKYFYTKGE